MKDQLEIIAEAVPSQEKANELMGRMFDITRPEAVFSQPVTSHDFTVITASENSVGLGFGFGGGGAVDTSEKVESEKPEIGYGAGGGGGGGSASRPVAAIIIGPEGVRVEPIVDPTKIALAFFTTLISLWAMLGRMKRHARS